MPLASWVTSPRSFPVELEETHEALQAHLPSLLVATTRLIFDQAGIPDAALEHIDGGWKKMYWEPLTRYLAHAKA